MSEVDEESSCSTVDEADDGGSGNIEERNLSFFHVQPQSLSRGYEGDAGLEILQKKYEQSEFTGKIKSSKASQRLKECAKWLDFKKPLDERRLCQAVSMNDTASVAHLLKQGVSPNCYDCFRRSPLHLASCKGFAHIIKILLDAGADPNLRDSIGNTPLHLAACTNHISVVILLLQAGSDGLSIDSLGRSPLQLAQSKLRILQNSNVTEQEVKSQVSQVIELLLMFSRNGPDAERLSEVKKRVNVAESREQVDNELQALLNDLGSLNISKAT